MTIQDIINDFKNHQLQYGLGGDPELEELYKWKLVTDQIGHPDVNADNFAKEINSLSLKNLCYSTQTTAIRHFAEYEPEEYRKTFVGLFDENIGLQERIDKFISDCRELWDGKTKHNFTQKTSAMCDERLISFFLTLKDPTKYTFYKDEVYGSLCNLLGEKKKNAGQKLVHFYELLNKHVIPAVESETALIDSINKEIDAKGYVHSTPLIAQTALWYYARHVRNNDKTQIWLFLGGKGADDYHFEEMYNDGSMALCGWEKVGDLGDCNDLNSIEERRKSVPEYESNTTHLSPMLHAIANEIKEGDIILAKERGADIVGMGIVTSDYYFDSDSSYGVHCRKVQWTYKGLWKCDAILKEYGKAQFPAKALTNVSNTNKYPYIQKIINMIKGNNAEKQYWLLGHAFGSTNPQFDRFITEGILEGRFDENKPVDQRQLALARRIKVGDVILLKSTATKGANHDIPFMRIKAVGLVTDKLIEEQGTEYLTLRCNVNYLSTTDKDFDSSVYGSYRQTVHEADDKVKDVIEYANSIINPTRMPQNKYSKYIELLQENRNLVLTGAPGTGKTYMAQAIAKEMGCSKEEMCFVQFHPSYDYTDFVEGLRPIEKSDGQMGFERKDGVFKDFCKKAAKNITDSQKSIESLTKELSWEEKLQQFIEDSTENNTKYKLSNGSEFTIDEIKGRTIVVHNDQNEKTTQVSVNADDIIELLTNEVPLNIVRDIRNYFNRKFGTQPDSYAYIITKAIREMKSNVYVESANKVEKKPFVFIIDEINRGEASKIFGELFYAIDPGYRGKNEHLVQTQYQNLVPETDVFAKGFYVPENVYILATMNDIDRSVESMDFAMRRRFTWKEVTPADTEEMLDTLPCYDEAKVTMQRLNKAIADTDGLGAAYMIGPSYFLKLKDNGADFNKLWKMNIEPLLKEYLRGFRKTAEILEKFSKAYFNTNESQTTDTPKLIDED
ncbi:MAG: AAA family ATPase [Prevotella sp.]|nr:AAA family ATPase [Prevotella sp.]